MSEEKKEILTEDIKPPKPDVPIPKDEPLVKALSGSKEGKEGEETNRKMAGEVESGRSPYDYSASLSGASRSGSSGALAYVASGIAIVALLLAGFVGFRVYTDMTDRIDSMSMEVRGLTEKARSREKAFQVSGDMAIRVELRKALVSIEGAIALGDESTTAETLRLRDEIKAILGELDSVVQGGANTYNRKDVTDDVNPSPSVEPKALPAPDFVQEGDGGVTDSNSKLPKWENEKGEAGTN